MEPLFYSTGQVARQLGTTLAAIRILCENGVIASETTPGGHLRVPASEVERLKRDGLPPIPRPLPTLSAPSAGKGIAGGRGSSEYRAEPSDDVESAVEMVAITRSLLEKRKIDREIEETEDWFRDRQRQQAAAEAMERQRIEAKNAEELRLQWAHQWTQYALDSLPIGARRGVELEVHVAVEEALSLLQPRHPEEITRRLVDAAVHRALGPWRRKHDIERALIAAMDKLPWDLRRSSEYEALKQRAWDAAVAAAGNVREDASYREIETAAARATQPMIRAYQHLEACRRIVGRVYIFGATGEEQEAAKNAVWDRLAALPIGVAQMELERAQEAGVAPYRAAVAAKKEIVRLESEKQSRYRAAERRAEFQLVHIERYLEQEYDFDGGALEIRHEADRLRPLVREALIEALLENPYMTDDEIRKSMEDQIDGAV